MADEQQIEDSDRTRAGALSRHHRARSTSSHVGRDEEALDRLDEQGQAQTRAGGHLVRHMDRLVLKEEAHLVVREAGIRRPS